MAYNEGSRAFEYASKISHQHIINDDVVKEMVENLTLPAEISIEKISNRTIPFTPVESGISDIFAIDGGYTETKIKNQYPSSLLHFFQFGALHFPLEALITLETSMHPNPEDVKKLKNISRVKLALPTCNTLLNGCSTLTDSIRVALHKFLKAETLDESKSLLDTLAWFVFHKYKVDRTKEESSYWLSSYPEMPDNSSGITLHEHEMDNNFIFHDINNKQISLVDIFRLHESIDEISGAAGICGYVAGVVEHLILIHIIRYMVQYGNCLDKAMILMDRPTGFFGNTSRLIIPMRNLVNWLFEKHNLYLVGLEKSGAFVNHAKDIQHLLQPGTFIILDNDYIYEYISARQTNINIPYGSSSYYGHKIIFKSTHGKMYVISFPVRELLTNPKVEDFPNIMEILTLIDKLKCDMFDDALLPIALANRLVSLSAVPGSKILAKFAKNVLNEG